MKKVAILTINDNYSYGNRLQNYAVQEVLKKHSVEPETIHNQKCIYGKFYKHKIKEWIKKYIKKDIKSLKYNNFLEFNKNIKFSKYAIDYKHIPSTLSEKYECFLVGSDQIWNYNFARMSDVDFLTFAPKEKRNSISASFGIEEIPSELKEYYKKNLEEFNNISVREDAGKKIIKNLTGRDDVELLIDPTMMLDKQEWKKVSKKPKQMKENERYILNYFLGDLSEERKNEIERVAKENNCKIIDILDMNEEIYTSGPSEFLYLIENAFLVCTDSFHACVFSILYNKPFIIFEREGNMESMISRIETLCLTFELENRRFVGTIQKVQLECDYTKAYRILESERDKFNKFVDKILY